MTHTAPAPSADADDASDPSAAPVGDGWGAERASGLDDERWSAVQRARLLAGKVLGGAPSDDDPDRVASKRELFMLFLSEEDDPEPFYVKLAERSVAEFEFPLDGRRVLDLGSGPGYYSRAMQRRGAQVTAIDLGEENMRSAAAAGVRVAYADGTVLPFADRSFDGVLCSNMLEHTPTPEKIFDEIERVLRPGGWAWVSWTNWYSPWGGHSISPMHYFGPKLGSKLYIRMFGMPDRNLPFTTLWPTYISQMLRLVEQRPGLRLLDALPRYYPSQRWIVKVPGLREVVTWNCLLLLERVSA
ncbi:MAG: class I SAM-dependent methyltransferase [Acidimicrobiales bacterium]|nr:class I SAM-dependent methyltransferase [Acidimicrobiales bacterium]MCB1262554.1 class I SAM-dependent methyltransferase [Acidimicrobiales bacterium]